MNFGEWLQTYIKHDSGEVRQLRAGWDAAWKARQPEVDRLREALSNCRLAAENRWHVEGIVDAALDYKGGSRRDG